MSETAPPRAGRTWLVILPLFAFLLLAVGFWRGLSGDPSVVPSALIGKPVPEFTLPAIEGVNLPGLASADLKGQVSVVNVFASWCAPCREEHPLLMELAKRPGLRLVGINQKDRPANAKAFLDELGNPFAAAGSDQSGRVSLDWGVYGVPETYVIDAEGLIRYRKIGPLTADSLAKELLPQIEKAATPAAK